MDTDLCIIHYGLVYMSKKKKITEYKIGNDNIFADLELDDAGDLLARAQLGHTVRMILKKKKQLSEAWANFLILGKPRFQS